MTGHGANEGELEYGDWDDGQDDFYFEEETLEEARERMTLEEQAADAAYLAGKVAEDPSLRTGGLDYHDPFPEAS
jgi:hypothetical protein